ncbi:MAG: hypothetical protein V3W14_01350 [Candidatus Neomarinimicrobiota bacterium]
MESRHRRGSMLALSLPKDSMESRQRRGWAHSSISNDKSGIDAIGRIVA